MKGKKITPRLFSFVLVLILCLTQLTACFDLGEYSGSEHGHGSGSGHSHGSGGGGRGDDFGPYYDAIDDVKTVFLRNRDSEGNAIRGEKSYDVEDSLLNKYTVRDLAWGDESDEVERRQYTYIAIPFCEDLHVRSVALYLNADESRELEIYAFLLKGGDGIPSHPCFAGDPTEKIEYDEDGNETVIELDYDDPEDETAVGYLQTGSSAGKWTSFMFTGWTTGRYLEVEDDDVLLLQVRNNTGYVPLGTQCTFSFLNLLIYSEEKNG